MRQESWKHKDIRSDDPHVLALARVSGARLLFTNDQGLAAGIFTDRQISRRHARADLYTTIEHRDIRTVPTENLLNRADLCEG